MAHRRGDEWPDDEADLKQEIRKLRQQTIDGEARARDDHETARQTYLVELGKTDAERNAVAHAVSQMQAARTGAAAPAGERALHLSMWDLGRVASKYRKASAPLDSAASALTEAARKLNKAVSSRNALPSAIEEINRSAGLAHWHL